MQLSRPAAASNGQAVTDLLCESVISTTEIRAGPGIPRSGAQPRRLGRQRSGGGRRRSSEPTKRGAHRLGPAANRQQAAT